MGDNCNKKKLKKLCDESPTNTFFLQILNYNDKTKNIYVSDGYKQTIEIDKVVLKKTINSGHTSIVTFWTIYYKFDDRLLKTPVAIKYPINSDHDGYLKKEIEILEKLNKTDDDGNYVIKCRNRFVNCISKNDNNIPYIIMEKMNTINNNNFTIIMNSFIKKKKI